MNELSVIHADAGLASPAATLHQPLLETTRDLLRFIVCGSVDDGKSTLLGRLLHDCGLLFQDQLEGLAAVSGRFGTTGPGNLDFALLVDGLAAEREQGITIDVAYRYFSTPARKFIVADTPGHEQYTRNMATGASNADFAVILVDARKGLLTQTRRHSHIVSLLGIRRVVLAINKMDLVGWDEAAFETIAADYRRLAAGLGIAEVTCIPVSALTGDNVLRPATQAAWYRGPTLVEHLERVEVAAGDVVSAGAPFRLPVQWVSRPGPDFRGYAGTIAAGGIAVGDDIAVLPAGHTSRVVRILTPSGDSDRAVAGQAVTLVLDRAVDIARGDLLCATAQPAATGDRLTAHLLWLDEAPLVPGRSYLLRLGTAQANARIVAIDHAIDVNTQARIPADSLPLNGIAQVTLALDRMLPFDRYADCRATGGLILIDRQSNATVACGMIDGMIDGVSGGVIGEMPGRSPDVARHAMAVDRRARAALLGQRPCVLWFTGLSGSGKSTVADLVEQRLHARGRLTVTLDGDNLRHGLNRDLGFAAADRRENMRRLGEVARLMVEAGLVTLVSAISPYREDRRQARSLFAEDTFIEVFVDTPLAVCEARDPKGLYRRARAGEIAGFTGIDSPYEPPVAAELRLAGGAEAPEVLADRVVAALEERGFI